MNLLSDGYVYLGHHLATAGRNLQKFSDLSPHPQNRKYSEPNELKQFENWLNSGKPTAVHKMDNRIFRLKIPA